MSFIIIKVTYPNKEEVDKTINYLLQRQENCMPSFKPMDKNKTRLACFN